MYSMEDRDSLLAHGIYDYSECLCVFALLLQLLTFFVIKLYLVQAYIYAIGFLTYKNLIGYLFYNE